MCPILSNSQSCKASLKLLGDFWTLAIINALSSGELRYCEIQRAVGGVNPVTLANRLKKLEAASIITRSEETRDKISVTYSLSDHGKRALPILSALNEFSTSNQKA